MGPRRTQGSAGRGARLRSAALPALLTVAALVVTGDPAAAQEPAARDTADAADPDTAAAARPDSVRPAAAGAPDGEVAPLEGPLEGTLQDSVPERPPARLAFPPEIPAATSSRAVVTWNRDRILRSHALNLLELVQEMSSVTGVRATFFGGPAHALSGVFGPGFLTVRVDGREVTAMDGGQPDLTRFPLAYVHGVRLLQGATGWTVEITTLSRDEREAYSRIEGGSGDPGLESLRLVFDNGFGDHLHASAAVDLLDVDGQPESSGFNFWANFEWVPGEGGSGIELHLQNESLERDVVEFVEISRTELFLRGRLELGRGLQLEAHGGETGWQRDDLPPEAGDSLDFTVGSGGLALAGRWERAWARAAIASWEGAAHPDIQVDVEAGGRVAGPLSLDVAVRAASWEEFDATELRGGLALALPLGVTLRGEGATGTRGVPYLPFDRADSLEFDAVTGRLELRRDGFALYGLAERQSLDRQLPFGAVFDRLFEPAGPADVTALEGGADVPVVPLSWLLPGLAPIRAAGFFRFQEADAGQAVFYLPRYLSRGEVSLVDEFFEGNLELRLGVGWNYRSAMRVPSSLAATEATGAEQSVGEVTFFDFHLGIRILDALLFWRFDNMANRAGQDLSDLPFQTRRSVFGLKWEFRG
ncbi:MAG: Plug domain-containing protein [Gemmatimonadota bacterium]|nr:Plug domain-containing protein [Gemmatimonadota bacterium]